MRFDMVIPTYKRINKLDRMLNSINEKDLKFIDIYVYCDNNDKETVNKLEKKYPHVNFAVMSKQNRAFGIWNQHLKNCLNSDGMIYVCDDIEFLPNTLTILHKLFCQLYNDTDGMMTFNQVNLPNGSKYAMGLIGRKFADRYTQRQCFCPDYVSFYADTELGRYAEKAGRYAHGIACKIYHYHPSMYKKEQDEAHRIVRDGNAKLDKKVYNTRQNLRLLWGKNFILIRSKVK